MFSFEAWLKAGGDPNQTDEQGRTLLMVAVARGSLAAVDLLIQHKADCDRQQQQGATALRVQVRTQRSATSLVSSENRTRASAVAHVR